jgi:hypothetical protein
MQCVVRRLDFFMIHTFPKQLKGEKKEATGPRSDREQWLGGMQPVRNQNVAAHQYYGGFDTCKRTVIHRTKAIYFQYSVL